MRHRLAAIVLVTVGGCAGTRVNGAGVLLNMQPTPPTFAGAYDFALLDPVKGSTCYSKMTYTFDDSTIYWLAGEAFERLPALSRNAIGAAVFQILDSNPGFDSIVVTRVMVAAKDRDTSCATVYGRGIRLRKASTHLRESQPSDNHDDEGDEPAARSTKQPGESGEPKE